MSGDEDLGKLSVELDAKIGDFVASLKQARSELRDTGQGMDDAKDKAKKLDTSGFKAVSASLRTLGAASLALNLAALNGGMGEGITKGAQFAAVFSGIAETVTSMSAGFGALKTAMMEFFLPVTAAAAGLYASVSGLVGVIKVMTGEAKIDRSKNILGQMGDVYKAGSDAIGQAAQTIKDEVLGFNFSDMGNTISDAWNLGEEKNAADVADIQKQLEQGIEVYGQRWQAALDAQQEALDADESWANTLGELRLQAEERAKLWQKALRDSKAEFDAEQKRAGMMIDAATKSESQDYVARIGGIQPQQTDIGAPKLYNQLIDSFGNIGDKIYDTASTIGQGLVSAGSVFVGTIMNRMGDAGEVMQSAMQGFQQGGPWGAIAGVIADLVTRSQSFKETVNFTNEMLKELVKAFEPLAKAMKPMAFFTMQIVGVIANQLGPAFEAISPIFEGLANLLKYVAIGIATVFEKLGEVWNWMIGKLADFVGWFHDSWGDKVRKAEINLNGINAALDTLTNMTVAQADAAGKATDAIQGFAGILNGPSGFKVALARLGATNVGVGGSPSLMGYAGLRDNATGTTVNIASVIVENKTDTEALINDILRRTSFATTAASGSNPAANNGVPAAPASSSPVSSSMLGHAAARAALAGA